MITVVLERLANGKNRVRGCIDNRTVMSYDCEPSDSREIIEIILDEVAFAHKVNGRFDMTYIKLNDAAEKVYYGDPVKVCCDCKTKIEYLADFPGPRCLGCHAKKMEGAPLERPDFTKAINI